MEGARNKGPRGTNVRITSRVNYPACTTVNPIYEMAGHERTTRGACDEKECGPRLIVGGKTAGSAPRA